MTTFKKFETFEPITLNRFLIKFNKGVEVPQHVFKKFKLYNTNDEFSIKLETYNTTEYVFPMHEISKIHEITIEFLNPLGEILNGYVLPVLGTNVKLNCSYSENGLMITKFKFIIDPEKARLLYKNNLD